VKRLHRIFAIACIAHSLPVIAQHVTFVLPETENNIVLSFEPLSEGQHNFRSIHIESGGDNYRFMPKIPVARIPVSHDEKLQTGLWDKVSGLKIHPSHYFFVGKYTANSQSHTLLFFVSVPGASDAAPLFVLGFSTEGRPYKVLERSGLDLYAFKASNNENAFIIGKATMSQVISGDGSNGSKTPYVTTYDPFSVFVVRNLSIAEYSLGESRKYNRQHYVWAGPNSREDYAVLYNVPGHPKPMGAPASHVTVLLGTNRSPVQ